MKMTQLTVMAVAAMFGLTIAATAADATAEANKLPPASTKQGVTYVTDIKPIFEAACVKCHSGDKPKARLKMDTLEDVLKGTKMGKILTSGDSTNSFIIKSAAHLTKDHDSWMPPLNNKDGIKPLTPQEIGLIRAWIDQGAK